MSSYSKRKRRNRFYKKIRRFFFVIFLLSLLSLMVYVSVIIIKNTSKNDDSRLFDVFKNPQDVFNLKTLQVPDYVDVQLLSNTEARTGEKIKHVNDIVIHYTANPKTTAQNNRDYFNSEGVDVCSHFVVGIDGEIIQCVPLDEKSAASNSRNSDTISIEVCHEDSSGKFSDAAYESLTKLTAWLCKNAGISSEHIIRHYDITGKECPIYFVKHKSAWEKFKKDTQSKMKDTVIEIPTEEGNIQ